MRLVVFIPIALSSVPISNMELITTRRMFFAFADKNEVALMKKKSPIKDVNICIVSNRNCELYCIVYVTCSYFHL